MSLATEDLSYNDELRFRLSTLTALNNKGEQDAIEIYCKTLEELYGFQATFNDYAEIDELIEILKEIIAEEQKHTILLTNFFTKVSGIVPED